MLLTLLKILLNYLIHLNLFIKKFFTGNRKHIKKFGLNTDDSSVYMSSIFNEINYKIYFLKVDIEGSEYRILDTLVDNKNRISGLVIGL